MRFHGHDLNLLAALSVLLEERNVTRAAERLNLSQAATSNALNRLRDEFSDPLLVRIGRQMVLTDLARSIQPEVDEILRQIETRVLKPDQADPTSRSMDVVVMTADTVAIDLVARITRELSRIAPGVRLIVRPLVGNIEQSLESGAMDLLLIPRQFAATGHPLQVLYHEPFAVLACANGVWGPDARGSNARGPHPITQDDYLGATQVIVEIGPERKIPVDRAIVEQAHGKLIRGTTVSSQIQVPWHVLGTDQLGTVPQALAQQFTQLLPLTAYPMPLDLPPNQIVMQWNSRREHDSGLMWLCDQFARAGRGLEQSLS